MRQPMLRDYVLRHRRALVLAVVFSFVVAALHTATFGALVPFLDVLFGGEAGAPRGTPAPIARAIEPFVSFLSADRSRALLALALTIVAITAVKGVARFFQEWYAALVAHAACADLANDLAARALRVRWPSYVEAGSAAYLSRFTVDLESVRAGLRAVSGKAAQEPLKAAGTLLVLFAIDPALALLSITAFPLVAITFASLGRRVKKGLVRVLERRQEMLGLVSESLRGLRVVKAFGAEPLREREIRAGNERLLREHMKIVRADAMLSPLMEVFGAAAIGACVVVGGRSVLSGGIEAGAFLAFYVALVSLYEPIRKLTDAAVRVKALKAAAARIFETLAAPVEDAPGKGVPFARLERDLVFDRVSFSYSGGSVPSLRDVSFTARRGETVAIVGRSGAGKSTLLSLVPRFFEPTAGEIRIDGRALAEYDLATLRRGIGLVGQEIVLFGGTVRENITLGARGPVTDDALRSAAETAHAATFIERLPGGFDAPLAEGGSSLSRGERQRLSIARAILADPPILLLDEITSSLDAESEAAVQEALAAFSRGRTVLVIAHRLRTVESASRIVVLDRGAVAAVGTHAELARTSALYRALHASRFEDVTDSAEAPPVPPAPSEDLASVAKR